MTQSATSTTDYTDMHNPVGARVLMVRVDRHDTHTSVIVVSPFGTSLDRQFARHAEADAYLAFLQAEVTRGARVYEVEQTAGACTSAAAVYDELERDLIDSINVDLDAAQAARDQAAAELMADVKAILNAAPASLDAYRQAKPKTGTEGRVHTKPLTAAELGRIRAHNQGVVTLLPGQTWLVLRGIHRRIGGEPTYKPGTRRIIQSLKLTAAQLAEAGVDMNELERAA